MAEADFHSISRSRPTPSAKRQVVSPSSRFQQRSWLEKSKSKVLTGVAIVGIIFLCGLLLVWVGRYRHEQTLDALRSGILSLQNEKLKTAHAQAIFSLPQGEEDSVYLSQIVLLWQGRKAEENKDTNAAKGIYENAAKIEGPFTGEVLLSLARVSETVGDTNAALAARERFLSTYPNAPQAEIVRQKIGK